jgi:phosphoribosylformylglycinamidine synthase
VKFGVVQFPGSTCDYDCFYALNNVLKVKTEYIWHKQTNLEGYDGIFLPGGFTYGDYLRVGAIARFSPVMSAVIDYAAAGGLVLGICNGFQILTEAGLLPGALMRNNSLHFICKYSYLRVENNQTSYTNSCKSGQVLKIPCPNLLKTIRLYFAIVKRTERLLQGPIPMVPFIILLVYVIRKEMYWV